MIALLAAPSNLGLRPPYPTSVPGTAKAPEALREAGLFARLAEEAGARDAGVVLAGRYVDDATPGRLRNQDSIVEHARRLAQRIGEIRTAGDFPLVIGGDCSLLVGVGLALRTTGGRFGLVHLDGHTDFRNPGNSDACAALAGEDLAAAIGRHWPAIADIDGLGPYFDPADTVHAGCRDDDGELAEAQVAIRLVIRASDIIRDGAEATADRIREHADRPDLDGYWLHVDVDILDAAVMPAVDSPDPGGLQAGRLTELLGPRTPGDRRARRRLRPRSGPGRALRAAADGRRDRRSRTARRRTLITAQEAVASAASMSARSASM